MIKNIEQNEIIMKYMGGIYRTDLLYTYTKSGWSNTPLESGSEPIQSHEFRYHNNWNWLIPVVKDVLKELRTIQNKTMYGDDMEEIYIVRIEMTLNQLVIGTLYNEVVEAIKWINSKKEEKNGSNS